jgi:hypothetical protein
MRRREFLTILDGAATLAPWAAGAQPPIRRLGVLFVLGDIKSDITAHTKKLTDIDDGFEFHEGDDAAIIRHMHAQPNFQRAAFGNPLKPSWKRR